MFLTLKGSMADPSWASIIILADGDLIFRKFQSYIVLIVIRGGRGNDLKKCPNLNLS